MGPLEDECRQKFWTIPEEKFKMNFSKTFICLAALLAAAQAQRKSKNTDFSFHKVSVVKLPVQLRIP